MKLRLGTIWAMLLPCGFAARAVPDPRHNLYFRAFRASGIRFEIDESLNDPAFSWPRALLSHPVDFSTDPMRAQDLVLTDAGTSQVQPFPLAEAVLQEGRLKQAKVNFLSDLPFDPDSR